MTVSFEFESTGPVAACSLIVGRLSPERLNHAHVLTLKGS